MADLPPHYAASGPWPNKISYKQKVRKDKMNMSCKYKK
jgi:hypothetical protein